MTQQKLADIMECSLRAIQNWEGGQRDISTKNLSQLAVVLGTTTDYLMVLSDDPEPVAPHASVTPGKEEFHQQPATQADIHRLEAKLDALRRLIEERLPPR